jgi:hypothetical protein
VEGSCEHGIETSGSTKRWIILEWLKDRWLLKKDSAPVIYLKDVEDSAVVCFVTRPSGCLD